MSKIRSKANSKRNQYFYLLNFFTVEETGNAQLDAFITSAKRNSKLFACVVFYSSGVQDSDVFSVISEGLTRWNFTFQDRD